jgi:4-amino-4-deoxy-L-arabinose transferase-like glycosyltransferase
VQPVPRHIAALGLVVAAIAVAGWWGAIAVGPAAGPDAAEHMRYAAYFDRTGHLPPKSVNYEYSSPPAYQLAAVYVQRTARRVALGHGAVLPFLPAPLRRLGWLGLLALAGAVLASRSASPRARSAATAGAVVLVLVAFVAALARARDVPWASGQLISILSACGLVAVTWALARELLPGHRLVPLLAAGATAALPVVLREGIVFHPELPFALVVGLALLVFLRGAGAGWAVRHGAVVGALVGVAALTRQTAAIAAVALALAALLLGRRGALRFLAAAAVALLLVAGPWWGYQASRFGNPIQSNLDRPGYMLPDGQPRSFFVSLPAHDLVAHPYREAFANELLPKFHADLWSDWYGVDRNFWTAPSAADRVVASTQSILGLGADALVLAGLALLALPALVRVVRGRAGAGGDAVLATFALLALTAWAAFVVTLVRYPQAGGDPIKASYLAFLTPVAAILGVAYGERLWRRAPAWRLALAAWAVLYAVSYAGVLATTY